MTVGFGVLAIEIKGVVSQGQVGKLNGICFRDGAAPMVVYGLPHLKSMKALPAPAQNGAVQHIRKLSFLINFSFAQFLCPSLMPRLAANFLIR